MPENVSIPPLGGSKVVQIYIGDDAVLRADSRLPHGLILRDALDEFGINYETFKGIGLSGDVPRREGSGYKLTGAGLCLNTGKKVQLGSNSAQYDIGVDKEHIEKCREFLEKNGLAVEIM